MIDWYRVIIDATMIVLGFCWGRVYEQQKVIKMLDDLQKDLDRILAAAVSMEADNEDRTEG